MVIDFLISEVITTAGTQTTCPAVTGAIQLVVESDGNIASVVVNVTRTLLRTTVLELGLAIKVCETILYLTNYLIQVFIMLSTKRLSVTSL